MVLRWILALSLSLNLLIAGLGTWVILGAPGNPAGLARHWLARITERPVQPGDIVFLGDSLTSRGRWSEMFPDVPTYNAGIPGDTTGEVLARLERITSRDPAKIFLLIGTNDLSADVEVPRVSTNIEKIVAWIQSDSPDTQIYLQSLLPRDKTHRSSVENLNEKLIRIASKRNTKWINLYPSFLNAADGSIRDDLSCDELHLTQAGYELWRETLSTHINE